MKYLFFLIFFIAAIALGDTVDIIRQSDGSYAANIVVRFVDVVPTPSPTPTPDPGNTTDPQPISGYVVENFGGQHKINTTFPDRPIKFGFYEDPISGYKVTRLTDVNDVVPATGLNTGLPWSCTTPNRGFHNGYSRWSNVNVTGEYMIAFRTNNHSSLYKTDGTYLGPVVPNKNHAIGESAEVRWDRSGRPGTETTIYYHFGSVFYKQDVLKGYLSAEVICDVGTSITSTGDMDGSDDARYWTKKLTAGTCIVIDAYEKKILPGTVTQSPLGLDISPSGQWWTIVHSNTSAPEYGFRFYLMSDVISGDMSKPVYLPTLSAGHNGWAYDKNGDEVLVYQDNKNDWFCSFNPKTREVVQFAHYSSFGWGMNQHIGRIINTNQKGWALFSTYSRDESTWSYNQLFMVELTPNPRVWRIGCTMNRRWVSGTDVGGYFAEAFASITPKGDRVIWQSNWMGESNLELFAIDLPENWWSDLR